MKNILNHSECWTLIPFMETSQSTWMVGKQKLIVLLPRNLMYTHFTRTLKPHEQHRAHLKTPEDSPLTHSLARSLAPPLSLSPSVSLHLPETKVSTRCSPATSAPPPPQLPPVPRHDDVSGLAASLLGHAVSAHLADHRAP